MANLTSEKAIIDKLKEDHELTVSLLECVSSAIQALGERTAEGSYRNRGALQYGTLLVLHLSLISSKDSKASLDWVGYCIPIIPYLWIIENNIVRASALQV